jgi:DNA-binding MarR family transcriptional regulator
VSSQEDQEIRKLSRDEVISSLLRESKAQSSLMVLCQKAVAERLNLNPTDQECLELILLAPTTPGEIAKLTGLTTGAVTSVLDRLERAGFVKREHDSEDRRRIIVRADVDKIKGHLSPLMTCVTDGFTDLCGEYSDEELRFLLDFSLRVQDTFKYATATLREQPLPSNARTG